MKKIAIAMGLVVLLIALGTAGAAVASAESPDDDELGGRALRAGTLIELGPDWLLLETRGGELTVRVDADTRLRLSGVDEPTLADLEPGDRLAVYGRDTADGALLARLILRLPGRFDRGGLRGELLSITGSQLEIARAADGVAVIVRVDDSTRYRVPGVEQPSLSDLSPGDSVYALGRWDDDETLQARLVGVLPPGVEQTLHGRVTAIDGARIELHTRRGPALVLTDDQTAFRVPGVESATLADVVVGDELLAGGVMTDAGLAAVVVAVVPPEPRVVERHGLVAANDGQTLTLETRSGELLVRATSETRVRFAGVEGATLADIPLGYQALAVGRWDDQAGLLVARWVGARPVPAAGD